MHEGDIACRRSVFQHLQRNAVELLDAFVEPFDAGGGLAGGAKIPQVRMAVVPTPAGQLPAHPALGDTPGTTDGPADVSR